ncbi:MAG: hypothetical protein WC156_03200 [Pedobacter sp.]
MSPTKTLPGPCSICGAELKKASAAKHLTACLAATPGTTEYVIVKVVGAGLGDVDYWLFAAVPADASLEDLDGFLRQTWLECCGHMSAFREKRMEVPMSRKIGSLAALGAKLVHEYDFGSTTELEVSFAGKVTAGKLSGRSKIKLLVRNNAPEIACDVCGKTATQICTDCIYDGGLLCDRCAESHACETDFLLPVVNSPRCGVCAYEG